MTKVDLGNIMNGRKQFGQLTKAYLLRLETDAYFFSGEVDRRINYTAVQRFEMFEQPNARCAVNGRYEKLDLGCLPSLKLRSFDAISSLSRKANFFSGWPVSIFTPAMG